MLIICFIWNESFVLYIGNCVHALLCFASLDSPLQTDKMSKTVIKCQQCKKKYKKYSHKTKRNCFRISFLFNSGSHTLF